MNLPSTREYPPGQVGIADILTGQEYDIREYQVNGETTYGWICHPCAGQSGGSTNVSYDQAFGSYVRHYSRHHN